MPAHSGLGLCRHNRMFIYRAGVSWHKNEFRDPGLWFTKKSKLQFLSLNLTVEAQKPTIIINF